MRRPPGHFWGRTLREARAIAKQARFLGRDIAPLRISGLGPTVVLLHGLYATAGVFRPLQDRLRRAGDASILSFTYPPGPGIVELAERLAEVLRSEPRDAPIHLVGHSLGGLVMRYYVQEMVADRRVVETISLASPFAGSARAWLVPGQASADIRIGSPLLDKIRRGTERGNAVPHLSVCADEDALIVLPAFPDYGERARFPVVGHNGILFDERVLDLLERRILAGEGAFSGALR